MLCRNSYILAYTSFSEIVVLHCDRVNKPLKPSGEEIIMLEKDEVENLFEKVKMLEGKVEVLIANSHTRSEQ